MVLFPSLTCLPTQGIVVSSCGRNDRLCCLFVPPRRLKMAVQFTHPLSVHPNLFDRPKICQIAIPAMKISNIRLNIMCFLLWWTLLDTQTAIFPNQNWLLDAIQSSPSTKLLLCPCTLMTCLCWSHVNNGLG